MQRIGPKEKVLLNSGVGYWYLNTMFEDPIDRQMWKNVGLKDYVVLGNFSSMPCARGNYVWLEHPKIFKCEYSEPERNAFIPGLITFDKV
jgi:hypothetical protein